MYTTITVPKMIIFCLIVHALVTWKMPKLAQILTFVGKFVVIVSVHV